MLLASGRTYAVVSVGKQSFALLAVLLPCFACNRPQVAPHSALLTSAADSEASQSPKLSVKARSDSGTPGASIRAADFEELMKASFLKSVHAINMDEACKDALRREIEISTTAFGDLDGDGREEAAVTAFSCFAGNGGPDLISVFKMNPDGALRELTIEPRKWTDRFKGRDPTQGLRGQMTVAIDKGRMIERFPIFKETDGGCCASGGFREFIYRWDGSQLALTDVVDVTKQAAQPRP